jgi:hypothetical protein
LTQILSTADASPQGPPSGAHAHGIRSGAGSEVLDAGICALIF